MQSNATEAIALRRFNDDLESLKTKFVNLHVELDVHKRGYTFENLPASQVIG